MSMSLGRSVSVYEMFRVIGRAGIATRSASAEGISAYLRTLGPEELLEEYHRAVATLLSRNLLTPQERVEVSEYARDWLDTEHAIGL